MVKNHPPGPMKKHTTWQVYFYRNILIYKQITLLQPARLSEINVVEAVDCAHHLRLRHIDHHIYLAAMIWFQLKRFRDTKYHNMM